MRVGSCGFCPYILYRSSNRRRQTAKLKKYVAEVYTLEIVRVVTPRLSLASMNASPTKKIDGYSHDGFFTVVRRAPTVCLCVYMYILDRSLESNNWFGWVPSAHRRRFITRQNRPGSILLERNLPRAIETNRNESNRTNEPALEYQTIRSNQHVNNSRSVPQKKKRTSHTRVI